jgi:hypothetical protein
MSSDEQSCLRNAVCDCGDLISHRELHDLEEWIEPRDAGGDAGYLGINDDPVLAYAGGSKSICKSAYCGGCHCRRPRELAREGSYFGLRGALGWDVDRDCASRLRERRVAEAGGRGTEDCIA